MISFNLKKARIFLAFFIFSLTGFAQRNLVFNPSFEIIDTCLITVTPFQNINSYGWYALCCADMYSICSNATEAGVPQNRLGYQYPRTGNNYVGLQTYNAGTNRDYILGQLKSTLFNNSTIIKINFYSTPKKNK